MVWLCCKIYKRFTSQFTGVVSWGLCFSLIIALYRKLRIRFLGVLFYFELSCACLSWNYFYRIIDLLVSLLCLDTNKKYCYIFCEISVLKIFSMLLKFETSESYAKL